VLLATGWILVSVNFAQGKLSEFSASQLFRVSRPSALLKESEAEVDPAQITRADRRPQTATSTQQPRYVEGQLIVRFREGTLLGTSRRIIAGQRASILKKLDRQGLEYVVRLPAGQRVNEAADQFSTSPEVEYAEPNVLYYTDVVPNDALYSMFDGQPSQLQRWYYAGSVLDSNLNAETAWDISRGDSNIVIAVIDTGVLLTHPDLANNLWKNSRETTNGIDGDANGYIDDVAGWDFYHDNNDPNPDLGDGIGDHNVFHGTFVAGCVAAVSGNGIGVTGASWLSRVMPLKVFTYDGGAPASAIAEALHYAADNGAHIVNMSFGSVYKSKTMSRAVDYAWRNGLVLVAAAGNANSKRPQYPAHCKNVIAVGGTSDASNPRGRASFSNFGSKAVDVVAPAIDIVSTAVLSKSDELQGGGHAGDAAYFYGNGTSFAAPLVAGEIALLMAHARELDLTLSNADYRQIVLGATINLGDDPNDSPNGRAKWAGHGRVDFLAGLQMVEAMAN
jgi:subtilisin family serine protease